MKYLLKLSVLSNFLFADLPHAVRDWYSDFTTSDSAASTTYDKYVWELEDIDIVFSNRAGCSGKNLTPEQVSDLLVARLGG